MPLPQINIAGNGRYAVITPMRNELRTFERTCQSLLAQTTLPACWFILDDGSSDGSETVAAQHAQQYPWVFHIKIKDRGYDFVGQGVADLLNHGIDLLGRSGIEVEFVAKLDADMSFPENYFATLIQDFKQEPRLGIESGHPYVKENGRTVFERHSDYFPSGVARLYRAAYLNEIGYFVSSVGWDTVDILRMRMRGYLTRIRHDTPIHHMRRMGTRQGYVDGMVRDGRNNYLTGYTPWFFTLRALFNMRYYPYLLRTLCMLYGYFRTYLRNTPRAVSNEEYAFHAHLQKSRLLGKELDQYGSAK